MTSVACSHNLEVHILPSWGSETLSDIPNRQIVQAVIVGGIFAASVVPTSCLISWEKTSWISLFTGFQLSSHLLEIFFVKLSFMFAGLTGLCFTEHEHY